MSSLTVGTISVPQRPMFYAYPSANTSFSVNETTLTDWQVQVNVGGGGFSNGIYTVPEAGYYKVELSLMKYSTSSDIGFYLEKNNTIVQRMCYIGGTSTFLMGSGSLIVDCAVNDELNIAVNLGGSVQMYGNATASVAIGAWTMYKLG